MEHIKLTLISNYNASGFTMVIQIDLTFHLIDSWNDLWNMPNCGVLPHEAKSMWLSNYIHLLA